MHGYTLHVLRHVLPHCTAGMEEAIFGKKEASQTAADAELKITVSDE